MDDLLQDLIAYAIEKRQVIFILLYRIKNFRLNFERKMIC